MGIVEKESREVQKRTPSRLRLRMISYLQRYQRVSRGCNAEKEAQRTQKSWLPWSRMYRSQSCNDSLGSHHSRSASLSNLCSRSCRRWLTNFFAGWAIQPNEFHLEELFHGVVIRIRTWSRYRKSRWLQDRYRDCEPTLVIRKVYFNWRSQDALLENIDLRNQISISTVPRTQSWRVFTLLRNRMIEVLTNHCELQIESKSIKASCIWFCIRIEL